MHMRCQARQLDSYSTARHCSTARQLDRTRQTSTLRRMQSASTCLDSYSTATRQLLDSYSTATRQLLDSYSTGSTGKALTAPRQRPRQRLDGATTARQLDSQGSTARAAGGGGRASARSNAPPPPPLPRGDQAGTARSRGDTSLSRRARPCSKR